MAFGKPKAWYGFKAGPANASFQVFGDLEECAREYEARAHLSRVQTRTVARVMASSLAEAQEMFRLGKWEPFDF